MRISAQRGRFRRPLAALTAAAATLGIVSPAAADHTDPPERVSLMGSLQSEIGCAADWDGDCTANDLVRIAGTSAYETVATVPAGSYEYKVRLDGSWEENYGDNGAPDGANIPLVLQHAGKLRFSYDHATHRIAVAPADPAPGLTAADRALARTSLRKDLTRERFYFVMADRFENGDASNDLGGYADDRLVSGYDPTARGFYHGGDLRGIIKRLDYIKGAGTTAIWLTPSFKNKPVQGSGDNISAGYHGYWITDFTQIDPHLGTNEDLEELVDKAHAKGMKVFFDIITNHTADVIDYAEGQYGYISKEQQPYRDAEGEVFDDRDFAGTEEFPKLDREVSFPYTPVFPAPADETVKVPAWLNDPLRYHNRGNAKFDGGESDQYGDFFGLDDLFTEQPEVVDGMKDIYKAWVDFGIDGFRIDTVKHVNMEFWQDFAPAIQKHAVAAGTPKFFSFGEVYDADPSKTSRYTTEGKLQATLDFGFQSRAAGFGNGRPTAEMRDLFAADDWYTDADSNAYSLPTFLGNHDMGRIGKFLLDGGATGDELLKRDQLTHALMYLVRGQPVVYYGDEQGFVGDGGDQLARQDMFPSKVAEYNDDDLIGTDATTAQSNFDTSHPLYTRLRQLSTLRAAHPTLADGTQVHRYASGSAGVYAFSRVNDADDIEYVVAANNAEEPKRVTFSTFSPKMTFAGLWPRGTKSVASDVEGRITVTVPPLSVLVWRATGAIPKAKAAPAPFFKTPGPGATVGGRAEVGVGVPGGGLNQVTFAWRPAGGEKWTALGTDDNAPYRVFHDVTGVAKGSLVEYRAVLRDHSGNLSVTSTYATVGDAPTGGGGGGDGGGDGGPVTQPANVSVPGNLNSEMGCSADWNPACEQARLTLDPADEIWKGTFDLPAGTYEYKAAIDKAWTENYGAGGVRDGGNISITVPGGPVTFYYDHRTHLITTDLQDPLVTAAGSFQSELGCPGDWSPACMRSWLQDLDGDGTYTFSTTGIPAGSYETKVTHGLSWEENYGLGGAPGGSNIAFTVPADGVRTTFTYVIDTHVLTVTTAKAGATPDLTKAKAHWLERDLLAWDLPEADRRGWTYRLHWAPEGGLGVDEEAVTGGSSVPLTYDAGGLPAEVKARFPHLATYDALRLAERDLGRVTSILTGQLAVAAYDDLGRLMDATGVQIPGVLDEVYAGARDRRLGVTWNGATPTIAVWAPTATDVDALVRRTGETTDRRVQLRKDAHGVWSVTGTSAWRNATYLFDVKVYAPTVGKVVRNRVTDPYSLGLTTNSERSVVVDLKDPALTPKGWTTLRKPQVAQPEDLSFYELHVRDFSINDETVPEYARGTYLAFRHGSSGGMKHLRGLADSGLNAVHLLPVFDIATIEERRPDQETPPCDLSSFAPDAAEQQECVGKVADSDGFNWGYDPLHYTTPEGSYATGPWGTNRTTEFRTMVKALNNAGLRAIMDVVYNHTTAAGQDEKSVLDRVVPGYYHRLSATGAVETSTCCANTATEHAMMEKLMVDSVVTWARDYKVDGFRFDLMGHHSKANMLAVRQALDALTVAKDGVDGKNIYLYGEGWNFGEVANDARFVQATQANMAGTGIGTFSDRLRDAVRGGGPFDENPRKQGFATGLLTDPNGDDTNGSEAEQRERLLLSHDQIKVGLAGNLKDYTFVDRTGKTVKGSDVDYNGSPAGYAADPSETITYVDAHDNETLFDALQYKLPQSTSMADRVRMNTIALSTTAFAQSPSFWHAGSDILRSKSLDRNSFNSGDWFNRIDWSYETSTWGSGLPPRQDNEAKWAFMRPLLADPDLRPAKADIVAARDRAWELQRIRYSSPLFRLGSAQLIQERVSFPTGGPEQDPGAIVMAIDDRDGTDLDAGSEGVVVVFNASDEETTQTVEGLAGGSYSLHPVQAQGVDAAVKRSSYDQDAGSFTVPARTVAVFMAR